MIGSGVSVVYSAVGDEHALMNAFRTFFVAVTGNFPSSLTWSFPTAGSVIDESNGVLQSSWTDSSPVASTGGSSANTWVNGVGTRVKWTTGAFHGGRRIVGSTFMVPLQINAYEGNGNIVGTNLAQFQSAGNALAASGYLLVWSKPRTGLTGAAVPVTGCEVPDKVSWLRGRRT